MSDHISRRPPLSVTLGELIADPSRADGLTLDALAILVAEISSRGAALTTLQGTLLSLMIGRRDGNRDGALADGLLDAPELAKRFGVPESWVREQARQGNLPCLKLGHYMRFRLEEVERFLTERANHPD
ncbi:MAG TPA: helix-turn-helix domain-containing protein [Candidatus Binataceae bacterium]|nr:helix-turn-helix domain-containing protein [Candidatus Binataceae bacterium]